VPAGLKQLAQTRNLFGEPFGPEIGQPPKDQVHAQPTRRVHRIRHFKNQPRLDGAQTIVKAVSLNLAKLALVELDRMGRAAR